MVALVDRLAKFHPTPLFRAVEVAIAVVTIIVGIFAAYGWALAYVVSLGAQPFQVYVWSCAVTGVVLVALGITRSGSRRHGNYVPVYGPTYALLGRVGALVVFAFYAKDQQALWGIVVGYSVYVSFLMYHVNRAQYHAERWRTWRNLADMSLAVAANVVDTHVVGVPILLFVLPVVVGGKYFWIDGSKLTLLAPLLVLAAFVVIRVNGFYADPAMAGAVDPTWLESQLSAGQVGVLVFAFLVLLVAIPVYDRRRIWWPCFERLEGFTAAVPNVRGWNNVAGLVAEQMRARYCDIVELDGVAETQLNFHLATPDCRWRGLASNSLHLETGIAAARSADRRLLVAISERNMSKDNIAAFSHEDCLTLAVMANLLTERLRQNSDVAPLTVVIKAEGVSQ